MSNRGAGGIKRGGRPRSKRPIATGVEAEAASDTELKEQGEELSDDEGPSSGAGSAAADPTDPTAASSAARSDEEGEADADPEQTLAALREQAAKLQAQLEAAEKRAARARAERSALRTQPASHGAARASHGPAAAPTAMDAARVKLPEMATYGGRVDENLDSWLRDARAMVRFQGLGVGDRAVSWMALYLKGDAQEWWQSEAEASVTTVAELDQALHRRFQPPQSAQVARKLVFETKQGSDGVAAYASRFQSAAAKVPGGMGAAEQVFAFTNGLRHAVAVEVVKQGCGTLQDAIQAAIMQESLALAQAGAGASSRPRGAASLNAGLSALGTDDADPEARSAEEPVACRCYLVPSGPWGREGRRAGRGTSGPGAGRKAT